ncbi:gustatory receptor for sugar taste 64f-like [Homalodisca vitripennis]|uniref:gustatory receptor for sugar taste 64f-like n=1 Tax=Homalodisca vitripennis TaxID=197043 RepID=UPI001EEC32EB|nr:gustatory receptor for sugar taste 64f-like [Homalodisca vitripennis]
MTPHPDVQLPIRDLWVSPDNDIRHRRGYSLLHEGDLRGNVQPTKTKYISGKDTMQVVLRPYIFVGQCFGLIPVRGIFSEDPKDLMFSWKAKRTIYSLIILAITTIMSLMHISGSLKYHGLGFKSLDYIVRGLMSIVHMIIFLGQAHSWPKLMIEWSKTERQMKHFHPILGLSKKIYFFIFMFGLGTVLLVMARIIGNFPSFHQCSEDLSELFLLSVYAMQYYIFLVTDFSLYKTVISVVFLIHRCLMNVYDELTIIVFTYSLYLRFRQLQEHLFKAKDKRMPITYWTKMRETYNQLSRLTRRLDDHLAWMTLVCFASNLYFICDLLLRTLSFKKNSSLTNWLTLYILLFTLVRTFGAALMASAVHNESKKLLPLLFSITSDSYNREVGRFKMQVIHSEIMITGCNFFSLTRSFILTVAGTIATYEVVLLQFGPPNEINFAPLNISEICGLIRQK